MPVEKIEPFVENLARLEVIKRWFEVIDAETLDPPGRNLELRREKETTKEAEETTGKAQETGLVVVARSVLTGSPWLLTLKRNKYA